MRGPLRTHAAITGLLSLLSLSLTALATTNLIPHKPPARLLAQQSPSSPFQDAAIIVAAAEQCRPGESACNAGCMPPRSECCADGNGYCREGYACVTDGCCPIGKTCSDKISCNLGEEPCGDNKCMPDGSVCCPNGAYCHAGEECAQNGFKQYCQRIGQSGSSHSSGGSTTAGETKSSGIAKATTSSHDQSTTKGLGSKTSQEAASVPASTSTSLKTTSSEHETNKPIVLPTLHLPPESSSSSSITSDISSSVTKDTSSSTLGLAATSSSNGNAAETVKIPGLELAFALVFVFLAVIGT